MILAVVVGLLFGAADQYLGSLKPMVALGSWTVSASQMSALWLLLPFGVGWRERLPRRAMVAGLVVTIGGLVGYLAMMLGPAEGLPTGRVPSAAAAWVASNTLVIAGGLLTGPLFGFLGSRWRVSRSWWAALALASAFVFEPLTRRVSGRLLGPSWAWFTEAALGVVFMAAFGVVGWRAGPGRNVPSAA